MNKIKMEMNMKTMKWALFLLVLTMIGCKNKEYQVKLMQEKIWQLKNMKYEEKDVQVPEKLPELFFADSSACSGFAGCNRFFGKYEVDEQGNLSIQVSGTTMMTCPEIEFEDLYLKVLPKVKRYTMKEKELILEDEKKMFSLHYVLKEE